MSEFSQGFQTGYNSTANPFENIIKRVDEGRARRLAERQTEDKEISDVKNLVVALGMKHEYDKKMSEFQTGQDVKAEKEKLKLRGRPLAGTPFEALSGQGKSVDLDGEQYFIPESSEEEKERLQLEKLRMDVQSKTPEGQEQALQMKMKEKELSKGAELLPKLDQAQEAVSRLKDQYYRGDTPKSVKRGDVFGGLFERGQGMAQGAAANFGANAELKTYINNRKAFASLISKGGFLESGVLTDVDIQRILGILPTSQSTKEEADAAWREVEGILGSARKRFDAKLNNPQQSSSSINQGQLSSGFKYTIEE